MATVVSENMRESVEAALEELAYHVRESSDPEELRAAVDTIEFGIACFLEAYGPQEQDHIFLSMRALHAMTEEKVKYVEWRKALN